MIFKSEAPKHETVLLTPVSSDPYKAPQRPFLSAADFQYIR